MNTHTKNDSQEFEGKSLCSLLKNRAETCVWKTSEEVKWRRTSKRRRIDWKVYREKESKSPLLLQNSMSTFLIFYSSCRSVFFLCSSLVFSATLLLLSCCFFVVLLQRSLISEGNQFLKLADKFQFALRLLFFFLGFPHAAVVLNLWSSKQHFHQQLQQTCSAENLEAADESLLCPLFDALLSFCHLENKTVVNTFSLVNQIYEDEGTDEGTNVRIMKIGLTNQNAKMYKLFNYYIGLSNDLKPRHYSRKKSWRARQKKERIKYEPHLLRW